MDNKDYFVQKKVKLENLKKGDNFVLSNQLLDLIKNEDVKELVIKKYQLQEEVKIEFHMIDVLLPIIKKYTSRFDAVRLFATEDNVDTSFVIDECGEISFSIKQGLISDAVVDELHAVGIYDSVNMFYEGRKLSQYINYLKKKVRDPKLLAAVNESWQDRYEEKNSTLKPRLFRLLHEKVEDIYFLKSINSEKYRDYGIGETFVLTILELHRLSILGENSFFISSIALSESNIEIILRSSEEHHLPDLGYIHPSISIRNVDQGNTSIGFYSSLEFKLANRDDDGVLHFFPNKKVKDIELNKTFSHTVNPDTFVDSYGSIESFFLDVDAFKNDFFFLKNTLTPDELRAKIADKITNTRSIFKGVKDLQILFTRGADNYVDNLSSLLQLCGKAEVIEMGYDLKFKLRYLISNVLLYGNNNID